LDGTEVRPPESGDPQTLWDKGNSEAFTALLLCMSDEIVECVSGCTSPTEIWGKLSSVYQSVSGESKDAL